MKNKIIVKLKNQNSVYIYIIIILFFSKKREGWKKLKNQSGFFQKTYFRCRDLNPGLSGESRVS